MSNEINFELGEHEIKISLNKGVVIKSKQYSNKSKNFTREKISQNATRKTLAITMKRLPYLGLLVSIVLVFSRIFQNPFSTKNWCIAFMELASGAAQIFSGKYFFIYMICKI